MVNGLPQPLLWLPVITGVKRVGELLPDAYDPAIPPVEELDELETFVGSKKTELGFGLPLVTSEKGS